MKILHKNLLIGGLLALVSMPLFAQEADVSYFDNYGGLTLETDTLSESNPLMNREPVQYNNPRFDDVIWQKIVYRVIDLREKVNFPLYFPEKSTDGRERLYTTIMKLFQDSTSGVKGYEADENGNVKPFIKEVDVKRVFDECYIEYEYNIDSISGDTLPGIKEVDETSLKGNYVVKYYIKELWYFDKGNSTLNVRIMAICPVMRQPDPEDMSKTLTTPMFWTPFDQLRPYLAKKLALVTERNTGQRETMDDLFIKRKFGSYIYKESNIRDRTILQYCVTADQVHKEQNRIKTSIINFEQDLWEY